MITVGVVKRRACSLFSARLARPTTEVLAVFGSHLSSHGWSPNIAEGRNYLFVCLFLCAGLGLRDGQTRRSFGSHHALELGALPESSARR